MQNYQDISIFSRDIGVTRPEHPLFSITFGHKNSNSIADIVFTAGFYIISFQKVVSGNITYGKKDFDHGRGKMLFFKPNQIITFRNVKSEDDCFLIMIKADYFSGTALHKELKNYGFFDYETHEALYLSPSEEDTIWNLVRTMHQEMYNNTDPYSKAIMTAHLGTLFSYSQRFYSRQIINRLEVNGPVGCKFQHILNAYYDEDKKQRSGLPTVAYMADQFNFSSRYLSDLLKQETGKTAIELIHLHLINEAKNYLLKGSLNISEISFILGFENPNYFARLFKKEVGIPPKEFRFNHLN